MAGTGHLYEIVNVLAVRSYLMERGRYLRTSFANDWLTSKKVVKFFTQEKFTEVVSPENFDIMIDAFDQEQIGHLRRKIDAGENLRMFSKLRTEALGPDLPHMIDWLLHIERSDQKRLSKLYKMTVEQVSEAAAKWTSWSTDNVERGREQVLIEFDNGMFWVEMLDEKSIKAEGAILNHCIGGYSSQLQSGNYRLFSLRGEGNNSIISVAVYHNLLRMQWWLEQARGHSNNPVPVHCEQALADLMNHLGICGPKDVSGTGVTFGADGVWKRVINSRKEILWQEHVCYVDGLSALVMSNHVPGLYLAEIIFSDERLIVQDGSKEQHTGKIDPKAVVKITANRHFHIIEQRAVAKLMNRLGTSEYTSREPFIGYSNGQAVPLLDAYERRVIAGIECIVRTKGNPLGDDKYGMDEFEIVIPHSRDLARTLVKIGKLRSGYGTKSYENSVRHVSDLKVALVVDPDRLNSFETNRVLSVINELGTIEEFLNEKATDASFEEWYDKFKPRRVVKTGRWVSLSIDGIKEPAITDIKDGYWLHCNGHAEFFYRNKSISLRQWKENELLSVSEPHYSDVANLKDETIAFLNKYGWNPSVEYFWSNSFPFNKNEYYISSITGTVSKMIYYLHGMWRLAETDDELIKAFTTKLPKKRKYAFTPAESSAILRLLPMDYVSDEMDEVLVTALQSWSKSVNARSCEYYYWRTQKEFIVNLLRLYDRVSPAAQKKCSQYLRRFLLRKTKRMKSFTGEKETMDYIVMLHQHLSDKEFVKLMKKACQSYNLMPASHRAPNPEWRKMYDRLKAISDYSAREISHQISWLFFHLDPHKIFHDNPMTFDEAVAWVDIAEISYDNYCVYRIEDGCKGLLDYMLIASKNDIEGDWKIPISKLRFVIKEIGEAEARKQEIRRIEVEKQNRWWDEYKARNAA